MTGAVVNGKTYTILYNDEGIRTSKTKSGITTTYYLNGSQIISEETSGTATVYLYDAAGKPAGMKCYSNSGNQTTLETYWFDHNLQGDIIGVYSKTGTKLASYVYDAWGNFTVTYSNGGASIPAVVNNPFRYRGYYYDVDLGLYYLQSRYYDANTGRFISPDDVTYLGANGDLNSYNLYAYCSNNPVMYTDPSGYWIETVLDLLSLGTSIVEVIINPANPWAWAGLAGDALDLIPFVTGLGESVKGTRIVAKGIDLTDDSLDVIRFTKAVDFGDDALDTIKTLRRSNNFTKSSSAAGIRIHKGYKPNIPGKEHGKIRGIRMDFYNEYSNTIFELKPFNRRSLRAGVNQLLRYRKQVGRNSSMILEFY